MISRQIFRRGRIFPIGQSWLEKRQEIINRAHKLSVNRQAIGERTPRRSRRCARGRERIDACSISSVTSIVSLQVKGWRDVSRTAVVLSKT